MNYASTSPSHRQNLVVEFVEKYDHKIKPDDDKLKEVILRSLANGQK
jgi:hypothetical protein